MFSILWLSRVSLPILVAAAFLAVMPSGASAAKKKDYAATTLPDGSIEIVVSGKTGLPSGTQVKVIDLRKKLEDAAVRECPDGHELTIDGAVSFGVLPNGGGFISKQRGVVRCKTPVPATP